MQKQGIYTIQENAPLTREVYRMVLAGNTGAITAPGQFVNIRVEGCYLRRPISVADWDDNTITLIYKVVGEGTRRLSRMGGPGAALHAPDLGFRHFKGIDAALTDAFLMHVKHNGRGLVHGLAENVAQNGNDKFHAGIIVIMQQNAIAIRLLNLAFHKTLAVAVHIRLSAHAVSSMLSPCVSPSASRNRVRSGSSKTKDSRGGSPCAPRHS